MVTLVQSLVRLSVGDNCVRICHCCIMHYDMHQKWADKAWAYKQLHSHADHHNNTVMLYYAVGSF